MEVSEELFSILQEINVKRNRLHFNMETVFEFSTENLSKLKRMCLAVEKAEVLTKRIAKDAGISDEEGSMKVKFVEGRGE